MKLPALVIAFSWLISVPSLGGLSMSFEGIDACLHRASRIFVVELIKKPKRPQVMYIGDCIDHKVRVVYALKGIPPKKPAIVCTAGAIDLGTRYVVFDFSQNTDGALRDNGDFSPFPMPVSISEQALQGKSNREQLSQIIMTRIKELEVSKEEGADIKKAKLVRGLEEDTRRMRLRLEKDKESGKPEATK
jgi:hypothetical protein